MNDKIDDQRKNSKIWDDLYQQFEKGKPVGISYPTEALVIFVSNLRKNQSVNNYFSDAAQEYSIKNNYSGNALEIGFGSIANLKLLRDKGFSCYGVEVSDEVVLRGKVQLEAAYGQDMGGVAIFSWDPNNDLPFADNFFELIVGLQSVYYNLDFEFFVKKVYSKLRKEGHFLFSFFTPNHSYMKYTLPVAPSFVRFDDNHPNYRLRGATLVAPATKDELITLFKPFRDVRVFTTESDQTPLFESWWYVTGKK